MRLSIMMKGIHCMYLFVLRSLSSNRIARGLWVMDKRVRGTFSDG